MRPGGTPGWHIENALCPGQCFGAAGSVQMRGQPVLANSLTYRVVFPCLEQHHEQAFTHGQLMEIQRDFDIVETPLEGVAAYWLSIKKLVEGKRNFKMLGEEADYTTEPYVKYLLECINADTPEERLLHIAAIRRDSMIQALARKFDLMRMALLDVATAENPRKTLAKMTAQYAQSPLNEEKAFGYAQELVQQAGENMAERGKFFNVDHRLRDDRLMVTLLFYVIWARREGKMGCEPFLEFIASSYFTDGLALVIDGFDAPFVRKRLQVHKAAIVDETRVKMELSAELCVAVKQKLAYDDVFRIARAWLV